MAGKWVVAVEKGDRPDTRPWLGSTRIDGAVDFAGFERAPFDRRAQFTHASEDFFWSFSSWQKNLLKAGNRFTIDAAVVRLGGDFQPVVDFVGDVFERDGGWHVSATFAASEQAGTLALRMEPIWNHYGIWRRHVKLTRADGFDGCKFAGSKA